MMLKEMTQKYASAHTHKPSVGGSFLEPILGVDSRDLSTQPLPIHTPCLKKNSQNYFRHHFVKFPPTLIIFGTKMAKTIILRTVHSFTT